jgi:hypothetical protein
VKVSNLQQLLAELARLLAAAGAGKQDAELAEFVRGLQPFAGESLTGFLRMAEKGKNPPKPPKTKESADELASAVKAVYDRPTADGMTAEGVDSLCARLAPLTKAQLAGVAERIDIFGAAKHTKPKLLELIRHQLRERIGTADRREMLDRPTLP